MRRAVAVVYLLAFAVAGSVAAESAKIQYEISGRFESIASVDELGIDGGSFRLTVVADRDAMPSDAQRIERRQVSRFQGAPSRLQITGASNARMNGIFRAAKETIEVSDSDSGDLCITFGKEFESSHATIDIPSVCFRRTGASVTGLPRNLTGDSLIGFQTFHSRNSAYAVTDGAVQVRGGGR